jgi:metal-responsive CopG/Arc/MetJ family transcriptional regulator
MSAVKVTLTLPTELVEVVDRYVAEHQGMTRSGLCAGALRSWLQQVQEAEIERYYTTMSDEERLENQAWADAAAESAAQIWR